MEYPLFNIVMSFSVVLMIVFGLLIGFDLNSKKLSNNLYLYSFYVIFHIGILLGIDLIVLGLMSIDGWIERIGFISDVADQEGRGDSKLWFSIMMIFGPLILLFMGWVFIKEFNRYRLILKKRIRRD